MSTNRLFNRATVMGVLVGIGLLMASGPLASEAQAHNSRHKPHLERKQTHGKHYRKRVARRVHHPVVVRRYHPRPVHVRVKRPWYVAAPRVYVQSTPFYFHSGLNVYLGGVYLGFEFTNAVPVGYVYADPYCQREFYSVAEYHSHVAYHPHPPVLEVVRVERCGY